MSASSFDPKARVACGTRDYWHISTIDETAAEEIFDLLNALYVLLNTEVNEFKWDPDLTIHDYEGLDSSRPSHYLTHTDYVFTNSSDKNYKSRDLSEDRLRDSTVNGIIEDLMGHYCRVAIDHRNLVPDQLLIKINFADMLSKIIRTYNQTRDEFFKKVIAVLDGRCAENDIVISNSNISEVKRIASLISQNLCELAYDAIAPMDQLMMSSLKARYGDGFSIGITMGFSTCSVIYKFHSIN